MIDYINTPRELIYKHRDNLNDFGVKDISSLNGRLFQLLSEHYLSTDGAEELISQCFNNAYYLCTIILLEDMPHFKIDKYKEALLKMNRRREVCAASFAMVYEMLQMCGPKYDRDSLLLKAIYHRFDNYEWLSLPARQTFYNLINKVKKDDIVLPQNEFAPRDIVEAIEDVGEEAPILLANSIAYICERLACIDDPQRRLLGADLTLSYLDSALKAIYENYDTKKNKFDSYYLSNDAADYLESIVDSVKKAIGDIIDFKQKTPIEAPRKPEKTAKADLAPLQARIKEQHNTIVKLTEENKELKEQLAGAQERINETVELRAEIDTLKEQLKDMQTLPPTITATQRVRMLLTLKIMEKAGIDEVFLGKFRRKDKVGTLMGIMLDIIPSTCKTYISDPCLNYEYHQKTVDSINSLLEELELDFRL